MPIEQGLTQYIQLQLAGSPPVTPPPGGFAEILPKDLISTTTRSAWKYWSILRKPTYTLEGQSSWTEWFVQIDCHGYAAADAQTLAYAIEAIFNALTRVAAFPLTLPDGTVVNSIEELDRPPEGFNDADRSFVTPLEYLISFEQT